MQRFHLPIPPGKLHCLNSTACPAEVLEAQADRHRELEALAS